MAIDPITGMVLAPVIGGVVSRLFGNSEAPEPTYTAAGQQATNFGQYAYDLLSGQPSAPSYTFNGQQIPAGDIRSLQFQRYGGYAPQATNQSMALQRLLEQQQSQSGQLALRGLVGQQTNMSELSGALSRQLNTSELQRQLSQQPNASELSGALSRKLDASELQRQLSIAQQTGNTDALNQILGQARSGYQQMMGGQYGYTPEEVEMQRAKLRSEMDRSNMEQQRAIQARYGAAGLRGGTAASAAMKQSQDYLNALSSGMADIGLGAAEARRSDTRDAQQIAANLLGIGSTAAGNIGQLSQQQQAQLLQSTAQLAELRNQARTADISGAAQLAELRNQAQATAVSGAGQLAELRNQARTADISGAAQLAELRNQARTAGITGASQLGQLEQSAYDTQVRGTSALDEMLQNQAQFNETQRIGAAQLNEQGRQFDIGIDSTSQDQRNRLATTAAEAPYAQWRDRINAAIAGLGGTAGAAVGADRNALETYGQRYQAAEDASRGFSNVASNAMDYYLRTRRTPTQTASAPNYRSGY